MYVNAWLQRHPDRPGKYPCGGPVAKMRDIWRLAAPSIDCFAPDIYVNAYREVCDEYAAAGNPLFIPEVRATKDSASFLFYAVGKHNALCFAPFGIEDLSSKRRDEMGADLLQTLNIGAGAFDVSRRRGAAGSGLRDGREYAGTDPGSPRKRQNPCFPRI